MEAVAGRVHTKAGGNTGYPAIDYFRMLAAVLVVAIHTSPLASISPAADYVLVRVVARLAVPFFFITSGFFLLPDAATKRRAYAFRHRLMGFTKRMMLLYAASMLLYLPLNIYMGYFSGEGLALRLTADVVWNGTFYHLWYFPAAILGAWIAAVLFAYLPRWAGFSLAGLLYAFGLAGDSYYRLAAQVPLLNEVLLRYFRVADYTRSGLFFAPLFILMGLHLAQNKNRRVWAAWADVAGFAASLACMLMEASWLSGHGFPKHDSMYIFLPFCSFFLFRLLCRANGAGNPLLRRTSLYLYILHPWCIAALNALGKRLGALRWMERASLTFFTSVLVVSGACALGAAWAVGKLQAQRRRFRYRERAVAQVNLDALRANLAAVRSVMQPECKVMAVVKADAYGHGAVPVARTLQKRGVDAFAVATMEEGMALRKKGIRGRILILGYTPPQNALRLRAFRLTQTVADAAHGQALAAQKCGVSVHVKVDTGMHRLGVPVQDQDDILRLYCLPGIHVTGIFTHLALADSLEEADVQRTREQNRLFESLLLFLHQHGVYPGITHVQSSYGVLNYPQFSYDYARVGLCLYGALDYALTPTCRQPALQSVLTLQARVASVRHVEAGETVGYNNAYRCVQDEDIATLAIGYADGVPRELAGGPVAYEQGNASVAGRVCMDQMMLRCEGKLPEPGGLVTLFGEEGALSAAGFAACGGTIPNEVLARIGPRVARRYMGTGWGDEGA